MTPIRVVEARFVEYVVAELAERELDAKRLQRFDVTPQVRLDEGERR